MEVLLCECFNDLRQSLFHLLNCLITEQGLDYRETEELSWYLSVSNSLWQRWSCRLVHCTGGNATGPIWRVLASSLRIFCWTPLKPQHSNLSLTLWPIKSGVLTSLLLPHLSSSLTDSLLSWISYATQKLMIDSCKMVEKQSESFHTFLWNFLQV